MTLPFTFFLHGLVTILTTPKKAANGKIAKRIAKFKIN